MEAHEVNHSGHRARMRERFFRTDLSGFQPYEILEMLLYYSVQRANTTLLARELLERFGSVRAVLNASPEVLMQVPGVSERTAFLFAYVRQLYGMMLSEEQAGIVLDDYGKVKEYVRQQFAFDDGRQEIMRCTALDGRLTVQASRIIGTGLGTEVLASADEIRKLAAQTKCKVFLLAHSHPESSAEPSREDIASTRLLLRQLLSEGLTLTDHIITGADGIVSMRERGFFFALEE